MKKFGQWLAYLIGTPCFYLSHYLLELADRLTGGQYKGFMGKRYATCRYGENAYQTPAHVYVNPFTSKNDPLKIEKFKQVGGSAASFNNNGDFDRLLQTATHIGATFHLNYGEVPTIVVGDKHGNPCGGSVNKDRRQAVKDTLEGDPLAIHGAVMIFNFLVDKEIADIVLHYNNGDNKRLIDGILAPAFTPEAIEMFARKNGKCPLLANPALLHLDRHCLDHSLIFRHLRGGNFLLQPNYTFILDLKNPDLKKYGQATPDQERDMLFLKAICDTSNSNTITIGKNGCLKGNGTGQQSRIAGVELGLLNLRRARHDPHGCTEVSDSFFLMTDAPEASITAGISAILSTSRPTFASKDKEIIEYCQRWGVPLYLIPDAKGRGFFNH
ncbi:MAG TPA: hypothetical protein VMD74_01265 [Candidatus Methylomirabilis sp.]|nr:hypothetical protein [Candidatus Methylomirabilis sp.]